MTDDTRNDFPVPAEVRNACRNDLHLPAPALGVARVHAEQIACKQCRFVTACAGANFKKDIAIVLGVLRQQ